MPRKSARSGGPGRGGARLGQQGQSYSNRSDLNQPVRTATGQPYGEAGRQAAAQKVIPLPGQGHGMGSSRGAGPGDHTYSTPAGPGANPMGGGSSPVSSPVGPGGMGSNAIQPGGLGPLTAPTNRPGEPLTAGLQGGAGPGPEALAPPPNPLVHAVATLNALGKTADPGTARIRAWLNATLNNSGAA